MVDEHAAESVCHVRLREEGSKLGGIGLKRLASLEFLEFVACEDGARGTVVFGWIPIGVQRPDEVLITSEVERSTELHICLDVRLGLVPPTEPPALEGLRRWIDRR